MTGMDNNIPHDCIIAGEKQGCQEHSAGVQPLRDCQNKKRIMLIAEHVQYSKYVMFGVYFDDFSLYFNVTSDFFSGFLKLQ